MIDKITVTETKETTVTREQILASITAITAEKTVKEADLTEAQARLDYQNSLLAEMDKGTKTLDSGTLKL